MSNINIIENWFTSNSRENVYYCANDGDYVKYFFKKNDESCLIVYGTTAFDVSEEHINDVRVVNDGRALVIITDGEIAKVGEDGIKYNVFVFSVDKGFSYFNYLKSEITNKKPVNVVDDEDEDEYDDELLRQEHEEEIIDAALDYMDIYGVDEIRISLCKECGKVMFQTSRHD
jgi:hypothetical protein